MQEKPRKAVRKRASTPVYVSPNQLTLCGFETPFEQALTSANRWVKLSRLLPWDDIVKPYDVQFKSEEGRPPISGRIPPLWVFFTNKSCPAEVSLLSQRALAKGPRHFWHVIIFFRLCGVLHQQILIHAE